LLAWAGAKIINALTQTMTHSSETEHCTGCDAGSGRRAFLARAALAVGSAFLALGATERDAVAMPMSRAIGLRRMGGTVTYPVPVADGATIDDANEMIIVRYRGAVYAFDLSCPHQHTALKWMGDEGRFQCPKHKSKYQPDGVFISGRATRNMDRHPIKMENGKILVEVDLILQSDKDQTAWTTAMIKV
jgi:nitrite reductase/ring-hydroxylating ferredoxin subunit